MYLKVLEFHQLKEDLDHGDFYQTKAGEALENDVLAYLSSRPVRFIVLAGCVGAGKTTFLNRLIQKMDSSGEYLVALMNHNDASKITESMVTEKLLRVIGEGAKKYKDGESKYEAIIEKIGSHPQRIVLMIDDAQNLKPKTLTVLKKITEKGISIVLSAHTQFAKKIERSMYEEVGLRLESFEVPGIIGSVRNYLEFLLEKSGGNIGIFSEEAIDDLSRLCHTPLQVRKMAWAALKKAVINKEKQVSDKTIHEILPIDFTHLWVELRRLGYTANEIAEEIMEDKKRVIQCLYGRLPEDDDLYKTLGVFLHGLGLKIASNEG
ncbi:MAG: AAA family ATPase [Desulfamplus sp.]|nr:AAA family ATPase [Desulfamplus sp.]